MPTHPPVGGAIRTPLARPQRIALGVALSGYLVALLFVSCVLVRYPADNDLDEIGWIVDHLSLRQPASLVANETYPFGLPVVLWVLRPGLGVLRAALAWQALAMTGLLLAIFLIAYRLFARADVAFGALGCGALLTLSVATSEFADGTAAMLLLAGCAVFVRHAPDRHGCFALGAGIGLASLFRLHYLVVPLFAPLALLVHRPAARRLAVLTGWVLAGFVAGAWPLLVLNLLTFWNPFHAGISQYMVGLFVTDTLDWDHFPATYNRWSVWRVASERPFDLIHHLVRQASELAHRKDVVGTFVLGAIGVGLAPTDVARRHLAFLALLAALYTGAIVLPTRFTDRAFVPVAAILAPLIAAGAIRATARVRPAWLAAVLTFGVMGLIAYQPASVSGLQLRRWWRDSNQRIVDVLTAHGMTASREVFCNDWNLYNLADPKFISFYNYGGWLLLDPRYAAERPPPRANTREEWAAFVRREGIRFVVVRRTPETASLFTEPAPAGWRLLAPALARFRVFEVSPRDPR